MLQRWRRDHRDFRTPSGNRLVPAPPTDDFIYQALLAVWPLTAPSLEDDGWIGELRERLTAYLEKASREAKVSTSWTDPDAAYETAVTRFIEALLDRTRAEAFHRQVAEFVALLAPQALWNSLGRVVLHLMAPGVPDIYRGDELWYAALVDPDNRRPVDWLTREKLMAETVLSGDPDVRSGQLSRLRDEMRAGELKLAITRELLALRKDIGALAGASCSLIAAEGERAGHLVVMERRTADVHLVAVVPRLTASLPAPRVAAAWGDTRIRIDAPGARRFRRVIHGGHVNGSGYLNAGEVLSTLAVEVLVAEAQGAWLVS